MGPDTYFHINYLIDANAAMVLFSNPEWESIRQSAAYDVRLEFSNGSEHASEAARGVRADHDGTRLRALVVTLAGDRFLADFAAADAMTLTVGNRRFATFALGATRTVAQQLRACAEQSLLRHGAEPGPAPGAPGGGPAVRPPVHLSGRITDDDYPADAIRAGEQGTVTFRMYVSAEGSVSRCIIVRPSGSARLDAATCMIALERFRFTPAVDARGRNVPGVATRTVRWELPLFEPPPPVTPTQE